MRRYKNQKCFCAIDTTAFSSMMAVLLIAVYVFYSAAAPGFHEYTSVHLPKVKHTTAQWGAASPEAITLIIKESGRYFLGSEQVTPEQIALKIQDRLNCGAPRKVYLKVDDHTRYKVLAQVLNAIQYAGVERIAFLTQPPRL